MLCYINYYIIPAALIILGYVASIPLATAESNVNAAFEGKKPSVQMLPRKTNTPPTASEQDHNMQTNPIIEQAINDLAKRESISPSIIKIVSFEEIVWSDTSLGCPHPDMRYIQVPQDGARIVLQLNERVYVYHSGGNRPPFPCNKPVQ